MIWEERKDDQGRSLHCAEEGRIQLYCTDMGKGKGGGWFINLGRLRLRQGWAESVESCKAEAEQALRWWNGDGKID